MNWIITLAVVGQLLIQGPPKFPLASSSSTLNTSLIAYWKLDESSDGSMAVTRVDSQGANDLTDNNTTASGTGKISNGADFETSNSEYLSITDNADLSLSTDTDFSLSFWVQLESKPASIMGLVIKGSNTSNQAEYSCFWNNGSDRFEFRVGNGTSNGTVVANALGAPSLATLYHVIAVHTGGSTDTIVIYVNNGAGNSASWTGGTQNTTGAFNIGARLAANFFDGIIDEVAFWKKALTSDERTELYNSGSGKTCCPF